MAARRSSLALLLLPLALLGAVPTRAAAEPAAVILVGDSTMATRTGYGDALCQRLQPALACLNLARGGRSTLSYRAEGLWDSLLEQLRVAPAGVQRHVLIQFGHNDQPGKPGRSTDLATDYPQNLARFVAELRAVGALPVLVTPLTRRSFKNGQLVDDLQPWAQAMRVLAREQQVPLVDLHALSSAAVRSMGSEEADSLAQAAPGQPAFDRTHVGPRGACLFAEQMSRELAQRLPSLALPRSSAPNCAEVPAPLVQPSAKP